MKTASLQSLGSPRALSHDALVFTARKLATDLALGSDASARAGSGLEYAQSRPYRAGDSLRRVDWRVTAKRGEMHSRDFESMHRVPLFAVVDTSASMSVSSTALSKLDGAIWIAAALGLLAQRRLSPASIVCAGERSVPVRPSLRAGDLWASLESLRSGNSGERTRLAPALATLGAHAQSTSLVVILSDFHDPQALEAVCKCAEKHDVIALHLIDPVEREASSLGFMEAVEAETGRRFLTTPRAASAARVAAREEFTELGCDYLELDLARAFVAPLRALLASHGGSARRAP